MHLGFMTWRHMQLSTNDMFKSSLLKKFDHAGVTRQFRHVIDTFWNNSITVYLPRINHW